MVRMKLRIDFTLILNPALALVSINMTFSSRALASPSSMETCLRMQHMGKW